jgi:hypothetical protein
MEMFAELGFGAGTGPWVAVVVVSRLAGKVGLTGKDSDAPALFDEAILVTDSGGV